MPARSAATITAGTPTRTRTPRSRPRTSRRHGHPHGHGHHHDPRPRGPWLAGLLAVGISGGLLPCPTALVVLLAAISLHRVGYGLVLIVAFSIGLAATITSIGLLAISARRVFSRWSFQGPVRSGFSPPSARS